MELIVKIVDRGDELPGSSRAGDVIAIMPDGHKWGSAELENPEWRIIRVPLTKVECDALLTSIEPETLADVPILRKYKIDFTLLPQKYCDSTTSKSKKDTPVIDATDSLIEFRSAIKIKNESDSDISCLTI